MDYASGAMPWSTLAKTRGSPRLDLSYLLSLSSFDSFASRSELLARAGSPFLPVSGLDSPTYSFHPNLPSCKYNLPFLCSDVLNDVHSGFKFAMLATPELDEALMDVAAITSPLGLVPKCKCHDPPWPRCTCPKSLLARKIVHASVPGGLNEQYLAAGVRKTWAQLDTHTVPQLVDGILNISRAHPDQLIVLSLTDGDAAHKQMVRHPIEWGCTLQRIGDLIFVSRGSDFGDAFACFLWDPLPSFLVHDLRSFANDSTEPCSSFSAYWGDDIVLASLASVHDALHSHLIHVGDSLAPGMWSIKKSPDWQPLHKRQVWGVELDTILLTIAVPLIKWHQSRDLATSMADLILQDSPLPVRDVQRFAGLLEWVAATVRPISPMFRAFYKVLSHATDRTLSDGNIVFDMPAHDRLRLLCDLDLVLMVLEHDSLRTQIMRHSDDTPTVFIASDASFYGFCIHITFCEDDDREPMIMYDAWMPHELARFLWLLLGNEFDAKNDFTINVGELLPVIFAVLTLEHLGLLLPGDVIHSTSDNDCVVCWIRSFRAKAPLALDLLKLLVLACIRCDVSMTSNHIPGEINHLCDYGSRFEHLQAFHELIAACNLTSHIREMPSQVRRLWGLLRSGMWLPVTSQAGFGHDTTDPGPQSGCPSFSASASRPSWDSHPSHHTAVSRIRLALLTSIETLSASCLTSNTS